MKRGIRRSLLIVLTAIFAVSMGMLARELIQYRQGAKTYDEARELAGIPNFTEVKNRPGTGAADSNSQTEPAADPYARQLDQMDFSALSKVNSDVFGWILIPGTAISYPLLSGGGNSYYLRHTWRKQSSVVGAIFLEERNSPRLTEFNVILYGHNMNNGSMFGTLKKYRDKDYWKAHRCLYVTTASGSRRYQIFAAYEADTRGRAYQVSFPSAASRRSFLNDCLKNSLYSTGVTPKTNDRILTLSTCTGHGHATRWVVQACMQGERAPAEK